MNYKGQGNNFVIETFVGEKTTIIRKIARYILDISDISCTLKYSIIKIVKVPGLDDLELFEKELGA